MACQQGGQVLYLSLLLGAVGVWMKDMQEFCAQETFKASCPQDSVVVMTGAMFGRMEMGRCVQKDLGYVGCSVDVLQEADRLCSGRHRCSFLVPELDGLMLTSGKKNPCMDELKSYLQASYTCLRVETVQSRMCKHSDHVTVSSTSGYIASIVTQETGCGTESNPWVIELQPGQRVNISLQDFATVDMPPSSPGHITRIGRRPCHAYAIIRERDVKDAVTVCGGPDRDSRVYLSRGHRLEIRIPSRSKTDNAHNFLLKYEAIGCPDMILGKDYIFERKETVAEVRCAHGGEIWKVRCHGKEWSGHIGNCSLGTGPNTGAVILGGISLSFEISVVIITLIASIISLCILIVGLVCIRKHHLRGRPPQGTNHHMSKSPQKGQDPQVTDRGRVQGHGGTGGTGGPGGPTTMRRDGNEYACILDMPLPPPPASTSGSFYDSALGGTTYDPDYSVHSYPRSAKYSGSTGTYHVYEVSKSPEPVHRFDEGPRYFELDPDNPNRGSPHRGPVQGVMPPNTNAACAEEVMERRLNPSRYST